MNASCGQRSVSLRLSVTGRCPLRCQYCVPASGYRFEGENSLSLSEMTAFVEFLQETYGLRKVRITGGEPLIRPDIEQLAACLSALGVPDVALTTNGQQLASRAVTLRQAGVRRINVSLDSLDPAVFRRLTGHGVLEKTLAGLAAARDAGLLPIRLNTVVMRGENETEVEHLLDFALRNGFEIRFLEVMPIGAMRESFEKHFVSSAETMRRIAAHHELHPASPTGTARNFAVKDRDGRAGILGFISPISEPFCATCRRLRLTASGDLIGCLGKDSRFPVRPFLRRDRFQELQEIVDTALSTKRRHEEFRGEASMAVIGG